MKPELEDQQLWQEHQDTVRVMAELGIDLEHQDQQEFFEQRQQQRNLELMARLCEVPLAGQHRDGSLWYSYEFRAGEGGHGEVKWCLSDEDWWVPPQHHLEMCEELNQLTGLRGTIQHCSCDGWHWHWPIGVETYSELCEIVETLDNLPLAKMEAICQRYLEARPNDDEPEAEI